jgi:hypothetical protein
MVYDIEEHAMMQIKQNFAWYAHFVHVRKDNISGRMPITLAI